MAIEFKGYIRWPFSIPAAASGMLFPYVVSLRCFTALALIYPKQTSD